MSGNALRLTGDDGVLRLSVKRLNIAVVVKKNFSFLMSPITSEKHPFSEVMIFK